MTTTTNPSKAKGRPRALPSAPRMTGRGADSELCADAGRHFIKWFADITMDDVPLVGGKNASLGEMYRTLARQGVRVPNGFAITAEAYRYLLREAGLEEPIRKALAGLDTRDVEELRKRGSSIR